MEPDGGGKRKGMNGGRSAVARWRSALGVEQPSQRTERPAVKREHKSNKRQQVMRSCRGGLWGWDSLSPMAQHEFTMSIACPRITYLDGVEPPPLELARLAPIHWGDLGIPFNMAFSKKQERFEARVCMGGQERRPRAPRQRQ